MRHIDLFSGIGGFAYAAKTVWGDEYENMFFCDNNKFCQEVIKKNFGKDSVIYDDIRNVTCADWNRLQEQREKQQAERDRQLFETVAYAEFNGRANGFTQTGRTERESEQGRLCESQGKNSVCVASDSESGKSGKQTEQKGWQNIGGGNCDLLTGGFPCQPFSQAGKRKGKADDRYLWPEMLRVIRDFKPTWIIAENVRGLLTIEGGLVFEQVCLDLERENYEVQPFVIPAVAVNAPHRRDRIWIIAHARYGNGTWEKNGRKLEGPIPCAENAIEFERPDRYENEWDRHWLEVATSTCDVRMDDGLPVELDGFKLTKAGHRVERLKALGNAIVPQVAIEIMKAIKQVGSR